LTMPDPVRLAAGETLVDGDAAKGERVFWAGGCASCHAAPGSTDDARLVLAGGLALKTPFGTFHAPNISSDSEAGIGAWTPLDFVNAMQRGLSPEGEHLYPSFPYASYAHMAQADVLDLHAYLKTLPASDTASIPHDLPFPVSIRRGLGLWKLLHLDPTPVIDVSNDAELLRGQALVEGMGHCGECHTPRGVTGGMDRTRWLAGGPAPETGGKEVPNITPHENGFGDWSAAEIEEVLTTGFTPDFDSLGGSMAEVVENLARLPKEDRAAIAAYLKAIPPVASAPTP
ncbi:cytochrome c, partial [Rhizobiaceae bacterium]|nr:cytochrome c [Rhizobiaceae bacterium]